MSYIHTINAFWRSHKSEAFSTTAIALYFHLLDINNEVKWIAPFKRNNSKICADLGISFPVMSRCRNRLKQAGLIDFKTVNGSANVFYTLKLSFKVVNEVIDEVSDEVSSGSSGTKERLRGKQNTDILIPPENSNLDFYFPFSAEVKTTFLAYFGAMKLKNKDVGVFHRELYVKKLNELSGGDNLKALAILEHSLLGNYPVLYAYKPTQSLNKQSENHGHKSDQDVHKPGYYDDSFASVLAKRPGGETSN